MNIKPIHNEIDYNMALQRVQELLDAVPGTEQGDELEIISTLLHAYEEETYPISSPDPIEAIYFRMEQRGLKVRDLEKIIHARSARIDEILNRSRPLTLVMIRKLTKELDIPSHVLIQDYPLLSLKKAHNAPIPH